MRGGQVPEPLFLETYLFDQVVDADRRSVRVRNEHRAPAYLARQFYQIIVGVLNEALDPAGITPPQWGVIAAVASEPGIDQRRLCARRSIDPNSASRLVDELELLGWMKRQPSVDDRRANALHLTAAGRKKYARLQPHTLAAQDRVLKPLAKAEKRTLLDLLTRVVIGNESYAKPGLGRRRPARRNAAPTEPARARRSPGPSRPLSGEHA
jgi:DNA-binding MarR family transcriptional regulator